MDRPIVYRGQVPFETDVMSAARYAYEALGLAMADLIGEATAVARLACGPTSPASLSVQVGPGSIYKFTSLDATAYGALAGTGGLPADTNVDHQIMKQGLLRDTQTFALTAPVTSGQSVVWLIEAQFQEADDAATPEQFWNPANPNAPLSETEAPFRRDICALQVKQGTPATTGTQTCPAADAGWVQVWAVTIAHGATTITAGNIAAAPSAPFISVGGGGGGGGATNWATITANYTASASDKLIADVSLATPYTIKMPTAPVADSSTVQVMGNFSTTNVTIDGNGHSWDLGPILGIQATFVLNKDSVGFTGVFDGTHWRIR